MGRYSRGFGEASTVGLLVTGREGDGYHNRVGGADLRWRISDQHNVQAQYLRSDTRYPVALAAEHDLAEGEFDGAATELRYDFATRNWFAYLVHSARTAGFRADSGFVPRVDYSQQVAGLARVWHGADDDWFSRIRLIGDWDVTHDDNGRLLEREFEAYVGVNAPLQSYVEVGGLTRDLLFEDILFHEDKLSIHAEFKPRGGLALGAWLQAGSQVDFDNTRLGDEVRLEPFLQWNVSRQLLLRYSGAFVELDTRDGQQIFDARVHDLRLTWQFSVRSFLRLTAQFQDVERNLEAYVEPADRQTRDVGYQLLYSYKLNPQTVFFLGYSEALLDDDSLQDLTATDRTWFMKIGYAWSR